MAKKKKNQKKGALSKGNIPLMSGPAMQRGVRTVDFPWQVSRSMEVNSWCD